MLAIVYFLVLATVDAHSWTARRPIVTGSASYDRSAAGNLTVFRNDILKKWRLTNTTTVTGYERYSSFTPIVSCPPGWVNERVGRGDGGKWLCGVRRLKSPCVIYSLGSGGDSSFEESMLSLTPCDVHTFDCTIGLNTSHPRHFYHKTCIGVPPPGHSLAAFFKSYREVTEQLGHRHVDVLKVDIEGYEYQLFENWSEAELLPLQVSVELHFQCSTVPASPVRGIPEMMLFFAHMSNLGYATVNREPNSGASCCYEYTFIRVEFPALHDY